MNHPDFVPCAFQLIIVIVIWQLIRYTNKRFPGSRIPVDGHVIEGDSEVDDATKTKLPEDHKKPGCVMAIFRTLFIIVALAIPFCIVFLIYLISPLGSFIVSGVVSFGFYEWKKHTSEHHR